MGTAFCPPSSAPHNAGAGCDVSHRGPHPCPQGRQCGRGARTVLARPLCQHSPRPPPAAESGSLCPARIEPSSSQRPALHLHLKVNLCLSPSRTFITRKWAVVGILIKGRRASWQAGNGELRVAADRAAFPAPQGSPETDGCAGGSLWPPGVLPTSDWGARGHAEALFTPVAPNPSSK